MKKHILMLLLLSGLLAIQPIVPCFSAQQTVPSRPSVALPPMANSPEACTDYYEPNDAFGSAWYLSAGTIQSCVCCEWGDMDYFQFSAQTGEAITLKLSNLADNYDLCLYNPSQTLISCSSNGGTTAETIETTATVTGDHYIRVFGAQGACNSGQPYTLSIAASGENELPGQIYFDQVRYHIDKEILMTVQISGTLLMQYQPHLEVWVSDPHHGDSERVLLAHQGLGVYVNTAGLPIVGGSATPQNGRLEANPGNLIYALYGWIGQEPGATGDIALVSGGTPSGNFTYSIDPDIMYGDKTLPGRGAGESDRPVAAMTATGYAPVRLGEDMVVFQPRNKVERDSLLARRTGQIVQERARDGTYVVRLDPTTQELDDFQVLADWLGMEGHLIFSSENAARLYNLVLEENLDGLRVTLNPLLMLAGEPETSEDPGVYPLFDEWWANDPNIQTNRAWVAASMLDTDENAVNLAVIDGGFRHGDDVLDPLVDGYDYDDGDGDPFGENPASCSGDSPCPWHGDWVWGAAGAVVNNGQNVAGAGGQVARPMYYRVGVSNWVFDMEDVMRRAVDHGADVINMSAGFPCRLGGINYCDPGERAGICAAVIIAIPLLAPLLGPTIQLGLAVFGVSLSVFCFTPFNPQQAMEDAALYAQDNGAVVVAAAGNAVSIAGVAFDAVDVADVLQVPCVVDGVICVGEMNSDKENLECWGDDVDIWGPTGLPRSGDVGNDLGGTSGTTGFISGVVALMKAINPGLTTPDVRDILQDSGHASPTDTLVHHFVDVWDAFQMAAAGVPARDDDLTQLLSFCPSLGWDETTVAGNDVYTRATDLSIGAGPIGPIDDAALHSFNDPADWYSLALTDDSTEGRYYHMDDQLTYADRVGTPSWFLYADPLGVPLDSDTLNTGARDFWPGTYYLRVTWSGDNDTCYNLDGAVMAPTPLARDACEQNDQIGTSCPLSPWQRDGESNVWRQQIEDLNFHTPTDPDWFSIAVPLGAPEPYPGLCPGVSRRAPAGGFTLVISDTQGPGETEFTTISGSEGQAVPGHHGQHKFLPHDEYDWLLDGVWFRTLGDEVLADPDGYSLELTYEVHTFDDVDEMCDTWADIWEVIEADASNGGLFWWIPVRPPLPMDFHWPMDLPCDPRVCDPPAMLPADYLGFEWTVAGPLRLEAWRPTGSNLRLQLLNRTGIVLGEAQPVIKQAAGNGQGKLPQALAEEMLVLELPQVQPDTYMVKVSEGEFGVQFRLRVTPLYHSIYLPMVMRKWQP